MVNHKIKGFHMIVRKNILIFDIHNERVNNRHRQIRINPEVQIRPSKKSCRLMRLDSSIFFVCSSDNLLSRCPNRKENFFIIFPIYELSCFRNTIFVFVLFDYLRCRTADLFLHGKNEKSSSLHKIPDVSLSSS